MKLASQIAVSVVVLSILSVTTAVQGGLISDQESFHHERIFHIRASIEDRLAAIRDRVSARRAHVEDRIDDIHERVEDKRDAIHDKIEDRQEAIHLKISAIKENIRFRRESIEEKISLRRQSIHERLAKIREHSFFPFTSHGFESTADVMWDEGAAPLGELTLQPVNNSREFVSALQLSESSIAAPPVGLSLEADEVDLAALADFTPIVPDATHGGPEASELLGVSASLLGTGGQAGFASLGVSLPEPATGLLLLFCAAGILRRARTSRVRPIACKHHA